MPTADHYREPAVAASRCARGGQSHAGADLLKARRPAPAQASKGVRKPRYHGWALVGALMSGCVCGKPGGTAV